MEDHRQLMERVELRQREAATATTDDVERLIETAKEGGIDQYPEQHDAVMKLWTIAHHGEEEAQTLAILGLGDLARNHENPGLESLALDRLDRVLKETPDYSSVQNQARQEIRDILRRG
jgi:hypothetical protein